MLSCTYGSWWPGLGTVKTTQFLKTCVVLLMSIY